MMTALPQVLHTYQNHHIDSTRWQQFKPRKDDIVISTSYKSGTTWTQGILKHLVFLHRELPPLDGLSPWLERRGRPLEEVLAVLDAQEHRRFIKSHLALDGLVFHPHLKYIVVARDARDVFMSMWNHYSHYNEEQYEHLNSQPGRVGPPFPHCPDDIHEFWKHWMGRGWFPWESEGYPFWGNLHHTATWWNYRRLDNILFVHFADLKRDIKGQVRRIAEFLDMRVTGADLDKIAVGVSLEAMRDEAERTQAGVTTSFVGGASTFFFKGVNGRWRDVLSARELELYYRQVEALLPPDAREWLERN